MGCWAWSPGTQTQDPLALQLPRPRRLQGDKALDHPGRKPEGERHARTCQVLPCSRLEFSRASQPTVACPQTLHPEPVRGRKLICGPRGAFPSIQASLGFFNSRRRKWGGLPDVHSTTWVLGTGHKSKIMMGPTLKRGASPLAAGALGRILQFQMLENQL